MDRRLIVGAPVYQRGWILEHWLEHLSKQWEFPPEETEIVACMAPSTDETEEILLSAEAKYGFSVAMITDDTGNNSEQRAWNLKRYEKMTVLRNRLLAYVRARQPEYYLSCDTDMLLPEHAVLKLAQELGRIGADGIAPLTYMSPGSTQFPNAMRHGGVQRELIQADTFFVGACFGVVLMTPELYGIDYAPHVNGEDLGWARNVQNAGLRLALTPHVLAKHVMNREMLDVVDERVGF